MSYFLPENYVARPGAVQGLDELRDEFQDYVYALAQKIYRESGLCTVLDYGTGSGFKLVKYFEHFCILDMWGIDREEQIAVNREKYPGWLWSTPERCRHLLKHEPVRPIDLIICADVIEHLDEPDEMLQFFSELKPKWIVISTPDRDLLAKETHMGPPRNPRHVREWSFREFRQYMDSRFQVENHLYSNRRQATQCVVARSR